MTEDVFAEVEIEKLTEEETKHIEQVLHHLKSFDKIEKQRLEKISKILQTSISNIPLSLQTITSENDKRCRVCNSLYIPLFKAQHQCTNCNCVLCRNCLSAYRGGCLLLCPICVKQFKEESLKGNCFFGSYDPKRSSIRVIKKILRRQSELRTQRDAAINLKTTDSKIEQSTPKLAKELQSTEKSHKMSSVKPLSDIEQVTLKDPTKIQQNISDISKDHLENNYDAQVKELKLKLQHNSESTILSEDEDDDVAVEKKLSLVGETSLENNVDDIIDGDGSDGSDEDDKLNLSSPQVSPLQLEFELSNDKNDGLVVKAAVPPRPTLAPSRSILRNNDTFDREPNDSQNDVVLPTALPSKPILASSGSTGISTFHHGKMSFTSKPPKLITSNGKHGKLSRIKPLPMLPAYSTPNINKDLEEKPAKPENLYRSESDLRDGHNHSRKTTLPAGSMHGLVDYSGSKISLTSVYSDGVVANHDSRMEITGEILISLQYDNKILTIEVAECRNLSPFNLTKKPLNSYVKTYLLPDKTKSSKRKTKVEHGTNNPKFHTSLTYKILSDKLFGRQLSISVYHQVRTGYNVFLGEILIHMNKDAFLPYATGSQWHALKPKIKKSSIISTMFDKGELIFALKYKPGAIVFNGTLQVWIVMARNVIAAKSNGLSSPFCKIILLPDKTTKRKTRVCHSTLNPEWNQLVEFDSVPGDELQCRSLEITIWDDNTIIGNEFLGGVKLNLGTGVAYGKTAKWMNAQGPEILAWSNMIANPNSAFESVIPLRANMD